MPEAIATAWLVVRCEARVARLPTVSTTVAAAMLAARTAVFMPPAMRVPIETVSRTRGAGPPAAAAARQAQAKRSKHSMLSNQGSSTLHQRSRALQPPSC